MRKVFDGNVLMMKALVSTAVGDAVVFTDSVGIAQTKGAIGEDISVDTRGVYEFTATDADTIAVGDVLYWKASTKKATTADGAGANIRIGTAWTPKAGSTAGLVDIKIG